MTDSRLAGKVAVITGATSGIGKSTAERFVRAGASVVLAGRRADLGRSIAQSLGAAAIFVQADVEHEDQIKSIFERAVQAFGRLDILFNNAGGPAPLGEITKVSTEDFETAVRVLFRSVFFGIKHAAPILCAQKSGSIISNASVAAHVGGYSSSHIYSALKAAVVHLSQSVALELAESGVRVNTVSPGAIATGIFGRGAGLSAARADDTAQLVAKKLRHAQPIARAGLPDDVASAVLFLASDEASFITGRDLVIDGGLIAGRRFKDAQAGAELWRTAFAAE
jgi:NAD(P)-dependent dehydrogenase (short-subunit alcohol dehydrogenase family)